MPTLPLSVFTFTFSDRCVNAQYLLTAGLTSSLLWWEKNKKFRGGSIKMPVYIFLKQYLHIQAAWFTNIRAASGSSIGGSNSLLCCPPHWQGGSLGCIVWVWQLSAPWHLSACCSPRGTYRCWGCALHICLSGKIELFLSRWNMHHARKFKVMEIYIQVYRIEVVWGVIRCCNMTTWQLWLRLFSFFNGALIAITELTDLCKWCNPAFYLMGLSGFIPLFHTDKRESESRTKKQTTASTLYEHSPLQNLIKWTS